MIGSWSVTENEYNQFIVTKSDTKLNKVVSRSQISQLLPTEYNQLEVTKPLTEYT